MWCCRSCRSCCGPKDQEAVIERRLPPLGLPANDDDSLFLSDSPRRPPKGSFRALPPRRLVSQVKKDPLKKESKKDPPKKESKKDPPKKESKKAERKPSTPPPKKPPIVEEPPPPSVEEPPPPPPHVLYSSLTADEKSSAKDRLEAIMKSFARDASAGAPCVLVQNPALVEKSCKTVYEIPPSNKTESFMKLDRALREAKLQEKSGGSPVRTFFVEQIQDILKNNDLQQKFPNISFPLLNHMFGFEVIDQDKKTQLLVLAFPRVSDGESLQLGMRLLWAKERRGGQMRSGLRLQSIGSEQNAQERLISRLKQQNPTAAELAAALKSLPPKKEGVVAA